MKYTIKKPIIIWCFILMFIIGIIFGYGIGDNFFESYLGRLSVITFRYGIIVIVLLTDYLVFDNLNRHVILCRYHTIDKFILKSTIIETAMIFLLTLVYNIPIIIFKLNIFQDIIQLICLFTLNTLIIMTFLTSIVRLVNVWINNRIISASAVFAGFVFIDFFLENINFLFINNAALDLTYIFILPYEYGLINYSIIAIILCVIIVLITYFTMTIIQRKDYFLTNDENL